MSELIKNKEQQINIKTDELILVVKRNKLFKDNAWQGLQKVDSNYYLDIISKEKEFLPRQEMEINPAYKQIIPYLVFNYQDQYFLMQRKANATEQRLKSKFSLGIGGHIRQQDLETNNIFDWAKREFDEEIAYNNSYDIEPLGILNDDSNPVGQVHLGFVFLLKGNSPSIKIKSELKCGNLYTLNECKDYYNQMENWTQIVFDFLQNPS